jgi:hypothetical protein
MLLIFFFALPSVALAFPSIGRLRQAESSPSPGKYIVKLRNDVTTTVVSDLKSFLKHTPTHEYSMPGFVGFASTLTTGDLARLQHSEQVRHKDPFVSPY